MSQWTGIDLFESANGGKMDENEYRTLVGTLVGTFASYGDFCALLCPISHDFVRLTFRDEFSNLIDISGR